MTTSDMINLHTLDQAGTASPPAIDVLVQTDFSDVVHPDSNA
jgi:hypothetical protein